MAAFDHIVVGGGISGMTCALLLARSGYSVALLEAGPQLAPVVRGFRRHNTHFDTGMHIVGGLENGQPLETYFTHLGLRRHITPVPYSEDGFERLVMGSGRATYDIPSGFDAYAARLSTYFPNEASAIQTYVDAVRSALDASPFLNFSRPFDSRSLLSGSTRTLQEFLASITDNNELKAILSYPNTFYGVPSDQALFSDHAMIAGSYLLSAHTLDGGGLSLVRAFEKELKRLGVSTQANARVRHIHVDEQNQFSAVTLASGETVSANACFWTAHPDSLLHVTDDSVFRPAFRKRLATLQSTPSGMMLFGVSEKNIPLLEGKNIVSLPGGSTDNCLTRNVPLAESAFYLTSSRDPVSGKYGVTVTAPASSDDYPPRGCGYAAYKRLQFEAMVSEVSRRFPELDGMVHFFDCATPRTFQHYSNAPEGTLYGLKHSIDQFNPAPVTKVRGLLLAGQSIVAPGILGAVVSAYLACGIVLGHETLQAELRNCT